MDFIVGLPKENEKYTTWVIVDRLIKYAHFITLSKKFIVVELTTKFIIEVYKLYGIPKVIIWDRDSIFKKLLERNFSLKWHNVSL